MLQLFSVTKFGNADDSGSRYVHVREGDVPFGKERREKRENGREI